MSPYLESAQISRPCLLRLLLGDPQARLRSLEDARASRESEPHHRIAWECGTGASSGYVCEDKLTNFGSLCPLLFHSKVRDPKIVMRSARDYFPHPSSPEECVKGLLFLQSNIQYWKLPDSLGFAAWNTFSNSAFPDEPVMKAFPSLKSTSTNLWEAKVLEILDCWNSREQTIQQTHFELWLDFVRADEEDSPAETRRYMDRPASLKRSPNLRRQ